MPDSVPPDSVPMNRDSAVRALPSTGSATDTKEQRDAWETRWPTLSFEHPEFFYRIGVLLCSAIFLIEATGSPFSEGVIPFGAATVLAILFTLTMAFQWRVLGDWRLPANQFLLVLFLATLVIPFTAILTPSLEEFPLPDNARVFLESTASDLMRIPGITALLSVAKGIVVFVFFLISMLVLIFNLDSTRKAGLTILGALYTILLLILYPTVETVVGLLFLIFFLRIHWEKPLMIPQKLKPHLSVLQLDYLRELVQEGSLSTGETKVYLNHNAALFGELLDYQLVEVDTIARDVIPGRRLINDASTQGMEKFASVVRRIMWITAGLLYFLLPDLIPFYFDDAIILLIASGAGFDWIRTLFGDKRKGQRRGRSRE